MVSIVVAAFSIIVVAVSIIVVAVSIIVVAWFRQSLGIVSMVGGGVVSGVVA